MTAPLPTGPTTIEAFEAMLVAVVAEAFPNLAVEPFPDRPNDWSFTHPEGAILVHFKSSRDVGSQSTGVTVQSRMLVWNFTVFGRSLRAVGGHIGATLILDGLRATLVGRKLRGASKAIQYVEETFLEEDEGVWQYLSSFEFPAPQIGLSPPQRDVFLRQIRSVTPEGALIRDVKEITP